MQHFLNLEKCNCGAYRYLAVREHKKSYEIYLIHHLHFSDGRNTRKYSKLASIPKFRINIHDQRLEEESKQKTILLNFDEAAVLKAVLRKLEYGIDAQEDSSNIEQSKDLTEEIQDEIEEPMVAVS
jgi:hypothetical protein